MEILKLNKTQEKKLLKLCKEFFPEYENIWLMGQTEFEAKYPISKSIVNFFTGKGKIKELYIHWYQLCLTELPKRIWDKFDFNNDVGKFPFWILDSLNNELPLLKKLVKTKQHPVDFLWDFVQECKKNKYFKTKTK